MRHGQCCWHAIGSASTPGTTVWWMDKFQGWRQTLPSSPTTQHFSHRLLKPPPETTRLYISRLIKSFHEQIAFALTSLWMGKLKAQRQRKALSWFYGQSCLPTPRAFTTRWLCHIWPGRLRPTKKPCLHKAALCKPSCKYIYLFLS